MPKDHKGIYIARQGVRVYLDELVERRDPRNKPYYWIGGEPPSGVDDEGSDLLGDEARVCFGDAVAASI